LIDKVFYIFILIVLAIAFEGAIAEAINNAGLTGITSALLMAALPGSLILYALVHSANQ